MHPQRRNAWWRAVRGALAMAAALAVVVVLVLAWALADVPWRKIAEGSLQPVVVLQTADGKPLVSRSARQDAYAARAEFPQHLVDAVVSAEDRRFNEHFGVDPMGIGRAALRNLSAGRVVQGGSTITQQLIKILYLESDRTFKRKIQEAVIAVWLERRLGKEEILTRYLNNVYLGAGATGMPAAARIYFNKKVGELDLGEAAMLAGLIRAPSVLNPLQNPKAARGRAEAVLDAMVADGRLNAQSAAVARADFARLNPTDPAPRSGSWFADWVMRDAREIAGPYRGTIRVGTTLVPRLQAIAEKVVDEALARQDGVGGGLQAALVAMRPDGAVVAMVGGRDYEQSEFNRAVSATRQPGSAFKLFTYYAAIKAGISLDDELMDQPIDVDGWAPENYDGRYAGRVSVAEAFMRSLNAATVALATEIGIDKVAAAARELGIDASLTETPSLALGTSGVSLIDLTGAYASVRAGLAPIEPWGISTFHAEGQPRSFSVGPAKAPATDLRPFQPQLIELLTLAVDQGTGRAAALDGFAAGKTGTSQNFRDAWFIGFNEDLVVGVWVGNDDETPMDRMTGGKLPASIWHDFMVEATGRADEPDVDEPDVVEPAIDDRIVSGSVLPRIVPPPPETQVRRVPLQEPPQTTVGEMTSSPAEAVPVETIDGDTAASVAIEGAPAMCNFRVCARFYRSFRPSDCTYQPYSGPRRICER